MRRRPRPLRLSEVLDAAMLGLVGSMFVFLLFVLLSWLFYAAARDSDNTHVDRRIAIERAFYTHGEQAADKSEHATAQRKQQAQQFLEFERRGSFERVDPKDDSTGFFNLSKHEYQLIERMAQTGEPFQLDTDRWHWSSYWDTMYGPMAWLLYWTAIGAVTFLSYGFDASEAGFALADLPWRRKWPWVFAFLCGPFAWIYLAGGAMFLRELAPATRMEREAQAFADDRESERERERSRPLPDYSLGGDEARRIYVDNRVYGGEGYLKRRLQALEARIAHGIAVNRDRAEQIKDTQADLAALRVTVTEVKERLESVSTDMTEIVAEQEFDRILALPEVVGVQVIDTDRIRFIIRAQHSYLGMVYDLGDWAIDLSRDSTYLRAREIRSGRHDGYGVMYGSSMDFCFGSRQTVLNEHLTKGQLLEALVVAINSLCSVNRGDRSSVPTRHRVLRKAVPGTDKEVVNDDPDESDESDDVEEG